MQHLLLRRPELLRNGREVGAWLKGWVFVIDSFHVDPSDVRMAFLDNVK